jgi:hypothetical protein
MLCTHQVQEILFVSANSDSAGHWRQSFYESIGLEQGAVGSVPSGEHGSGTFDVGMHLGLQNNLVLRMPFRGVFKL